MVRWQSKLYVVIAALPKICLLIHWKKLFVSVFVSGCLFQKPFMFLRGKSTRILESWMPYPYFYKHCLKFSEKTLNLEPFIFRLSHYETPGSAVVVLLRKKSGQSLLTLCLVDNFLLKNPTGGLTGFLMDLNDLWKYQDFYFKRINLVLLTFFINPVSTSSFPSSLHFKVSTVSFRSLASMVPACNKKLMTMNIIN